MNIVYVADPMCSWCYGFGQTMSALLADPREAAPLQLALVMGGLRPYTTDTLAPARADELIGHWQHVHEATGLPFTPAARSAIHRPGFVYDTEPASRATIVVRSLWPRHVWRYFKAVQHAFYAEGVDVTKTSALKALAEGQGLPGAEFEQAFESDAMRDAARHDFAQAQAWGIRGFPALLAEYRDQWHLLAHGYMPIEALHDRIAALGAAPH